MNNGWKEARKQVQLVERKRMDLILQLELLTMNMDVEELLCILRSDITKFGSNDKLILDVGKLIMEIYAEARHQVELGHDITPLQDMLREVCIAYKNSSVCPIDVQSFRDKLRRLNEKGIWDYILLLLVVILLCGAGYLSFLALRWYCTTHLVLKTVVSSLVVLFSVAWYTEKLKDLIAYIVIIVVILVLVGTLCGKLISLCMS